LQVFVLLLEAQATMPGEQTPVHTPLTHAWPEHVCAAAHCPLALQASVLVSFGHRVSFGAQTPVHAPATHVWSAHALAAPHAPLDEHVSTPLFEQVLVPLAQTPHRPAPLQKPCGQDTAVPH
jgi:hypothetical protein